MKENFKIGDTVTWKTKSHGIAKTKTGRIVRFFTGEESASYIAGKEFKNHTRMFRKCFASKPGVLVEDTEQQESQKTKLYKPYIHLLNKIGMLTMFLFSYGCAYKYWGP